MIETKMTDLDGNTVTFLQPETSKEAEKLRDTESSESLGDLQETTDDELIEMGVIGEDTPE